MKPIILFIISLAGLLSTPLVIAECINADINTIKPDAIYTDHGDGTVNDNETGLMWQKCPLGLSGNNCSTGTAQTFSWQAALAAANDNAGSGYTDWQLPNKNELETLTEDACSSPAINASVFPATGGGIYRTSSPYAVNNNEAWVVDFSTGSVFNWVKSFEYKVRLVRGSQ